MFDTGCLCCSVCSHFPLFVSLKSFRIFVAERIMRPGDSALKRKFENIFLYRFTRQNVSPCNKPCMNSEKHCQNVSVSKTMGTLDKLKCTLFRMTSWMVLARRFCSIFGKPKPSYGLGVVKKQVWPGNATITHTVPRGRDTEHR